MRAGTGHCPEVRGAGPQPRRAAFDYGSHTSRVTASGCLGRLNVFASRTPQIPDWLAEVLPAGKAGVVQEQQVERVDTWLLNVEETVRARGAEGCAVVVAAGAQCVCVHRCAHAPPCCAPDATATAPAALPLQLGNLQAATQQAQLLAVLKQGTQTLKELQTVGGWVVWVGCCLVERASGRVAHGARRRSSAALCASTHPPCQLSRVPCPRPSPAHPPTRASTHPPPTLSRAQAVPLEEVEQLMADAENAKEYEARLRGAMGERSRGGLPACGRARDQLPASTQGVAVARGAPAPRPSAP